MRQLNTILKPMEVNALALVLLTGCAKQSDSMSNADAANSATQSDPVSKTSPADAAKSIAPENYAHAEVSLSFKSIVQNVGNAPP